MIGPVDSINTHARFKWVIKDQDIESLLDPETLVADKLFHLLEPWNPKNSESPLQALPDPFLLKDIKKAVARIAEAIAKNQKIVVFADYDVDGITSAALLKRFFEALNFEIEVYIPDRISEGYGLNSNSIKHFAAKKVNLVITVDNGISAFDACSEAKNLGIDVIVTDHHDAMEVLPDAFAIINPKQPNCEYPFKYLSGVGVAFQLLIALRAHLRTLKIFSDLPNLKSYLDFVAIGTIADLVPLRGINHILCKVGLAVLNENIQYDARRGLTALWNLIEKNVNQPQIKCEHIGFQIGPRLNAAGRIGSALAAYELLVTPSAERAMELAKLLDRENQERQCIEKQATDTAFAMLAKLPEIPPAIMVGDSDWHPGVIGLVASRILEKYYRPVLVFGGNGDKCRLSGRSTHAVDIFNLLSPVKDRFIAFGGHFHAIGLTVLQTELQWLQEYFVNEVANISSIENMYKPIEIEAAVDLGSLNANLAMAIEQLEPFGIENARPRWLVKKVSVVDVKRIGKDLAANHAKVLLKDHSYEMWVTAFSFAQHLETKIGHDISSEIDAVLELRLRYWKGHKQLDVRLIDFRSRL